MILINGEMMVTEWVIMIVVLYYSDENRTYMFDRYIYTRNEHSYKLYVYICTYNVCIYNIRSRITKFDG
jgi:hypothetical protein